MAQNQTISRTDTYSNIDQGLRAHMSKVYSIMSGGMLITAFVAWVVGNDLSLMKFNQPTWIFSYEMLQAMFGSPLKYVIILAPLGVVFALSAGINRMSENMARGVFALFAALIGLSTATIFVIYTDASIVQTFLTTAIAFACLSIYGYTTKKDISAWGSFLLMGLFGIIIASILNIFLQSSALTFAISIIGLLVFAGLTAWDTQRIKNEYLQMAHMGNIEWMGKAAIMGALSLYLDFLNIFMFLLHFMGVRE